MDDLALLTAIANGHDQALRELFDRHAPWVAQRLRTSLPSDAVEDVVQETFVAVWRGSERFSGQGEPAAWIWGIARRQAALWLRSAGRPTLPLVTTETMASLDPSVQAIQRVDLEHALTSLGPEGEAQQQLVKLAYVEERGLGEVGQLLGIPAGTVKSRLFAVRKRLRAALLGEESRP